MNLPALQRKISEIVAEYNEKLEKIEQEVLEFEKAGDRLKASATIGGTWGNETIDTGRIHDRIIQSSLCKSAWRHVYKGLNIEDIAPASDKSRFEQAMSNPPEFTIDNIRATFGEYIKDPMGNILRGLAEVFCSLDQSYKSHDKVKVGVDGLPKRVIISGLNRYSGYGRDRLRDILNALAAYQGKPLATYQELSALEKDGDCLRTAGVLPKIGRYETEEETTIGRGVWLKKYKNGNGHLYFSPDTLLDINRALAAYYGDVLADCHEEKPENRKQSTDISRDLQYYPTPQAVVDRILMDLHVEGHKILEPSCGCGRIMDGLKENGARVFGIEFDPARAEVCRSKGHNVLTANFLEVIPTPIYDRVVMNPPFYGKHYAKHVTHAMKFLKPGGVLTAILPITARYDHGLLEGSWQDLPVGSFRESGTNINTTVLTMKKDKQ